MSFRLWYPQLDVYDAIRRMAGLLARWANPAPTFERLYVVDFYFANPPLLHGTHMPSDIREKFRSISVMRPERSFLSYPSAPILFAKMEAIQKEALQTLVGKGLLDLKQLEVGRVSPSKVSEAFFEKVIREHMSDEERIVLGFLVNFFSKIGIDQPGGLRAATGLRRVGL
jgi:hypothetical protein